MAMDIGQGWAGIEVVSMAMDVGQGYRIYKGWDRGSIYGYGCRARI